MQLRKKQPGAGFYRYGRDLADGVYEGRVLSAAVRTSRRGNEMIVIVLGIKGPSGGAKVDHYVATFDVPRVEEMLSALAPKCLDEWEAHGLIDFNPADLVGRICEVEIENRPWQGKPRSAVRAIRCYPF